MQLLPNIKIIDLCLYLEKEKVLILGDVHLGHEEHMSKQGILVPRQQFPLTMERLKKTLVSVQPEIVLINGDLKEEFGTINETEWRHTIKFIDFLAGKCKKLFLVKGNHDVLLEPIAKKRNIQIVDNFLIGDILVTHGDKLHEEVNLSGVKTIIMGHEHPAISIVDYPRVEKFKCFLLGKYKTKSLIIMPAYNSLVEGKDVLTNPGMGPFADNFEDFKVYVVGDEILEFGKVKEFEHPSFNI